MPAITFLEHDDTAHKVDAQAGLSLMEAAIAQQVPGIIGECGGSCICATCHVKVHPDWYELLGEPDGFEQSMLQGALGVTEHSRLGCQITVDENMDGLIVKLPEHQV